MKKNYSKLISSFLLAGLLITSCQKDSKEVGQEVSMQSAKDKPKNECRLTEMDVTLGNYKHHYNSQGLCDVWEISDYGTFKQEYNASGRLVKSKEYIDDELVCTIEFFYTGNNVTKEIWYYGNSSDVIDEVHYTFNPQGQNTRAESFLNDYYTVNTFDAAGNVTAFDFYVGGSPVFSGRYAFNYHYKNPYKAISGIEYGFPFINAAVPTSKFYFSKEKIIVYDEFGLPSLLYDYDAQQATWELASQNYPATAVYHDALTDDWVTYTFQYENCDKNEVNNSVSVQRISAPDYRSGKINPIKFLKKGSPNSIKHQVNELRQYLKKK